MIAVLYFRNYFLKKTYPCIDFDESQLLTMGKRIDEQFLWKYYPLHFAVILSHPLLHF